MRTKENLRFIECEEHYKNTSRFIGRVDIFRFRRNPQHYLHWLKEQVPFKKAEKILDLGCGPALLWQTYPGLLQPNHQLFLADRSFNMLVQARKNTTELKAEHIVLRSDMEQLGFPDQQFDAVLAHMLLYHATDIDKTLREIIRTLRPQGWFSATTFASRSENIIWETVHAIEPDIPPYSEILAPFSAENALPQLKNYFSSLKSTTYETGFVCPNPEIWADFICSFPNIELRQLRPEFRQKLIHALKKLITRHGTLPYQTEMAHYLCQGPLKN
ncbi:class I SAM-dependent methyltransferase [Endozoicomonas arenosclerae]|uniref:class I SAM-dependent methyltransferase n=1 Tax=Endozoicomonas arenosclerae TaxID=1633495 RepID=UPI000784E24A|nr:class I SAM-dependent methyltransferase [Endozoicomonas arenosclerae]